MELVYFMSTKSFLLTPDPLAPLADGATDVPKGISTMTKYIIGIFCGGMVAVGVYKIYYEESRVGITLIIGGGLIGAVAYALIKAAAGL